MVAATRVTAPPLRSARMPLRLLTAAMPRISSPPRAPAQLLPDQARTTRIQHGETNAQLIAVPPGRIVDEA